MHCPVRPSASLSTHKWFIKFFSLFYQERMHCHVRPSASLMGTPAITNDLLNFFRQSIKKGCIALFVHLLLLRVPRTHKWFIKFFSSIYQEGCIALFVHLLLLRVPPHTQVVY